MSRSTNCRARPSRRPNRSAASHRTAAADEEHQDTVTDGQDEDDNVAGGCDRESEDAIFVVFDGPKIVASVLDHFHDVAFIQTGVLDSADGVVVF